MTWVPPFTVNVATSQPACVVDVPLALSPYGLWCVLRLSQEVPVWLVKALWAILDDLPFYFQDPRLGELLPPAAVDEQLRDRVEAVAASWNGARVALDLVGRRQVFWPADTAEQSVVPKGMDQALVPRLDALAAALEQRHRPSIMPPIEAVDVLADCARDTLALAAALSQERAIVLTTVAQAREEPHLGTYLGDSGIPCRRLDEGEAKRLVCGALAPLLVRSGLLELIATGSLRLASMHLIVPRAPLVACEPAGDDAYPDRLEWNEMPVCDETDPWVDAQAVWCELP
jgi:hypothetical protein